MNDDATRSVVTLKEARANFGNLVRDAGIDRQIVYLSDRGRVIAAIAPLDIVEAGVKAVQQVNRGQDHEAQ